MRVGSRMKRLLRFSPTMAMLAASLGGCFALSSCADECTGSIECTVLYAKPGPKSVGRDIYVDVLNKPGLGSKKTLRYEGKEFGTFEHVVIINDPNNRFAANRSICFTTFRTLPAESGGALDEQGIVRIQPEK